MARFYKHTSSYVDAEGNAQTLVYYRAVSVADARQADLHNDKQALTDYERACASGQVSNVSTTIEEVDDIDG